MVDGVYRWLIALEVVAGWLGGSRGGWVCLETVGWVTRWMGGWLVGLEVVWVGGWWV